MRQPEQMVECVLTSAEADEITRLAAPVAEIISNDKNDLPRIFAAARAAHEHLPERLLSALRKDGTLGGHFGAIRITGIQPGDLPDTPGERREAGWGEVATAAAAQLAVCLGLGEPVAYREENGGALIQDIYSIPGDEDLQESSGLRDLVLHTENAFHYCPPDIVTLFCLRGDPSASALTGVACIRAVADELAAEDVAILRRPVFSIWPSSSFRLGDTDPAPVGPFPVVRDGPDGVELCADAHGLIAPDEASRGAVRRLERSLYDHAVKLGLKSGDLLMVNNRTAAHFRTAYGGSGGPLRRWLRRMSLVHDPVKRKIVTAASGRILTWSPAQILGDSD